MNLKLAFLILFCSAICSPRFVSAEVNRLFYKTCNFAKNDVLNVRERPDYHSKKVAELFLDQRIVVQTCVSQNKMSKWCKVKPLEQGANETAGWVNAKYITPTLYQEGYVTIKNRKSICDYVLRCENRNNKPQCLVVTGLKGDKEITLQTEWLDYQLLTPANNFSAADDNDLNPEGDYCTQGKYVAEYFKNIKLKQLARQFPAPEFQTVLALLTALHEGNEMAIASLIHPDKGIWLSALSYFDKKGSHWFSAESFLQHYKSRVVMDWGQSEAKGDTIRKDLYAYIEDLPKAISHISKVIHLKSLKNFPKSKGQKLSAYEVYWYQNENNKDYAYTGLVIILAAYQNKWFVVGISRDYWTP